MEPWQIFATQQLATAARYFKAFLWLVNFNQSAGAWYSRPSPDASRPTELQPSFPPENSGQTPLNNHIRSGTTLLCLPGLKNITAWHSSSATLITLFWGVSQLHQSIVHRSSMNMPRPLHQRLWGWWWVGWYLETLPVNGAGQGCRPSPPLPRCQSSYKRFLVTLIEISW